MKIVLAGSPQIALKTFATVIKNFDVKAVVTQQDQRQGRGLQLQETPVARLGKKHSLPVFKPTKIQDIRGELEVIKPDVLLTFAYGQIVPVSILRLFAMVPLNVHGSLLPKYRGAAPVQHAILNNEKDIGISLIEMIKEMDAGDVYFQAKQAISRETDAREGFKIVSDLANKNIVRWLNLVQQNKTRPQSQGVNFTLAPKIQKTDGLINLDTSKEKATRKVKAYAMDSGCYTFVNNKRLKIFRLTPTPRKNCLKIELKDGFLYCDDYQWESKKRVKIPE